MINKLRTMWAVANPAAQGVVAVMSIVGLVVLTVAVTVFLWELPMWLPTEISEHPVRAIFGLIISAWILLAVWVTFRKGGTW